MKTMHLFILLGTISKALAETIVCDGLIFNKVYYDKEVLFTNFGRPYNLAIHRYSGLLFFSHTLYKGTQLDFEITACNMKTKNCHDIKGIPGGYAVGYDRGNDDMYLGGHDGIYKYNFLTKTADYFAERGKSVWAIFISRHFYYIQYPSQKLMIYQDDSFVEVAEAIHTEIDVFYISSIRDIYFANKTALYKVESNTKDIIELNDEIVVRQIDEDAYGDVYFGASDGIYIEDKPYRRIKKIADVDKMFGLTFDDQDHVIYSDATSIYRLHPSNFSQVCYTALNEKTEIVEPVSTENRRKWYFRRNFYLLPFLEKIDFFCLQVSDDIGYVIYSALGSFYIPSCIMVFVYIRIYFAAKARARRGIRKNPRPRPGNEQQTSFSNPKGTRPMPVTHPMPAGHLSTNNNGESQISTIEAPQVQIPTVTCDLASDISTSEAGDTLPPPPDERKDTLKVVTSAQVTKNPLASCPLRSSTLSVNGELQLQQQTRGRQPSMVIDADMVSELEPSSSDSGVVSRCGGVKPLKLRIFKKSDRRQEKSQPSKAELEPALPKPHKPRDPEREKKRLARKKEKRATLILGLIMGSFIACWLPFFFLYILKAACRQCVIPPHAFAIAFWLGYMNSVLNPVIYTIFNKDFRRAFRRILFK